MKKMITESQLRDRVAALEAKLNELSAQDVGQAVGNVAGGVAGVAAAPVRAAGEVGQAVAQNAGKWWDAAKQGVQNFAGGVAQGAKQAWAATDPAKVAGQAAAATGMTSPGKYPTTPQEIKAFQQAHGLAADGVIGPKTQAALAQAGLKPAAPAKPATPKPAAGQAAATTGTTTPAAPQTQTQQNFAQAGMAGQEMRTADELKASADLANSGMEEGITTFRTESDSLARIIQLSR